MTMVLPDMAMRGPRLWVSRTLPARSILPRAEKVRPESCDTVK